MPIAVIGVLDHCYRMPKYEPLHPGVQIKASRSDLVAFQWQTNAVNAYFSLPDDDAHVLRVFFDCQCIVRLLDEMPLSTEVDETPDEGLVSEHFAYRLEGARFARTQSETWKEVAGPIAHYRFVTGWACMDVLSGCAPSFSVVVRPDGLSLPG